MDKPEVPFHAVMHKHKPKTFASLYEIERDVNKKDKVSILQADRRVLQRLVTAYEGGRSVELGDILKHELLPVPLALAEMNGSLRTGNKALLAEVLTHNTTCPETLKFEYPTSCLAIDVGGANGKASWCSYFWRLC